MANSLVEKVRGFFFEDAVEDILEDEQEVQDRFYNAPEKEDRHAERRKGKVVNMSTPNNVSQLPMSTMKMVLYKPFTYEDAQNIADNIKQRKPVIFDMSHLEIETMQRILDFAAGSAYALEATIRKVAFGIFVVVPSNMTLVFSEEDEMKA